MQTTKTPTKLRPYKTRIRLKHSDFDKTIPFEKILKKYNITEDDLKNYDDIVNKTKTRKQKPSPVLRLGIQGLAFLYIKKRSLLFNRLR